MTVQLSGMAVDTQGYVLLCLQLHAQMQHGTRTQHCMWRPMGLFLTATLTMPQASTSDSREFSDYKQLNTARLTCHSARASALFVCAPSNGLIGWSPPTRLHERPPIST